MTRGKPVIPDAAIAHHTILLGKTRAGKSSTMRGIVERLLDQDKPVGIIDPKGDWWGLKSSADGKRPGYPVIIFGGERADVPVNAFSGNHVAELVATGNRPFIIDLGGWMVGERTRFFIDFASMFFRHTRGPRHLVIDEVHNFAPQGKVHDVDAGKMLHWANRLASEGAGKGITLISASQRPQKVHKDYVTSHETLFAMRVIHPLDRGAVKDWIDGCPDPATGREVMVTLASLERGEGWVWSPEAKFGPVRIRFPLFKTYDSFAAPTTEQTAKLKGWASVDLDVVKTKLAAVVEEAKANDPATLKAEIAQLKREAGKTAPATPQAPSWPDQREEVARLRAAVGVEQTKSKALQLRLDAVAKLVGAELSAVGSLPVEPSAQPVAKPKPPPPAEKASPRPQPAPSSDGRLPPGERAVLIAAVQYGGVDRDQLSVLTGYKRSSRNAYIARLREKGLVETAGESVRPTDLAAEALGSDYEPLPTGQALQDYWMQRLPVGEAAILAILIENYPSPMERSALDERTAYKRSSRNAYIARLKARRLVDPVGDTVCASPGLF